MLRRAGVGVGAAVLAGLAMGVVARLMMRLVVLATGRETEFSWGGSLGILLAFVVFMVPGHCSCRCIAVAGGRCRRSWHALRSSSPRASPSRTSAPWDDLSALRWAGVVVAGLGVYAAILVLPGLTFRILSREVGTPDDVGPSGPRSDEHVDVKRTQWCRGRRTSRQRDAGRSSSTRSAGEHAHHQRSAPGVLLPGVVEQPRPLLAADH